LKYHIRKNEMNKITFLGTGAMGSRMALALLKAGLDVTVWNRNPERTQTLALQGAKVVATPADAVRGAQVVIAMLRDDEASRNVWIDSNALTTMPQDALAMECSTLSPMYVKQLAQAAQARGVAFLDAPVAGSRPQADAGQLIFMVGGAAADLARAQPLLAHMGAAVHHAGEAGAGASVKLLVNALFAAQVALMGELLGLASKMGLDVQRTLEIIAATPTCSPAAKGAAMGMLAKNFAPMFPIELVRKDMSYALDAAQHAAASLPMISTTARMLNAAADAGWQHDNLTAIAKLYT
jgi:3-hydroxyisobutyrate dehydrogenase